MGYMTDSVIMFQISDIEVTLLNKLLKFSKYPRDVGQLHDVNNARLYQKCLTYTAPFQCIIVKSELPIKIIKKLGKLEKVQLITEDLFKDNGSIPEYLIFALDSIESRAIFALTPPQKFFGPGWL